jgi:hypothetical protein
MVIGLLVGRTERICSFGVAEEVAERAAKRLTEKVAQRVTKRAAERVSESGIPLTLNSFMK